MENIINDNTKLAFAETYDIIKHSNKEIQNKIPSRFINILDRFKKSNYISEFDYSKNLENQNITYETKIILGIIYRDYLCDNRRKEELMRYESQLLEQIEKEKQKKYSSDDLFKNKKYSNEIQAMQVYKEENLFSKLFKTIKQILKINN